ncbi:toxin-antitoxin system YwqK family antitoxin [Corallococcus sp. BB11-1]|uniref:toxin-antitoxin system YwqK family antitoxin n=1 Tax=Corallococcus sp. BB11-1 TaxID=2996783 RepID=UPI00226F9FFA|nr:toxin-antitoxin system YwqK family antitoxin [Corallococcus sp. BB11-1]MCY1033881.1 toxin-antitoxin system YwqK family antitoxin [Corallococcus sp. BB11-1]
MNRGAEQKPGEVRPPGQEGQGARYTTFTRGEDGKALLQVTELRGDKLHGDSVLLSPQGQEVQRASFYDGVLDGEVVRNGEDGQVVLRQHYQEGKLHGEMLVYSMGKVRLRQTYAFGLLEGPMLVYSETGRVGVEVPFKSGKRQGDAKYFTPEGLLFRCEPYVDDKLHGEVFEYDERGAVRKRTVFQAGAQKDSPVLFDERGRETKKSREPPFIVKLAKLLRKPLGG